MDKNTHWFKDAVFYEVYVRAYRDSNGDGHGDLLGLVEKLDYLQDLGVDCLWLMPIFPSPLLDDGYDVADFRGIHPDFGNLDDFKLLIAEAHKRSIRIITDMVMNHTSDQHPWFQEARKDKNSRYRDYYVWSDTDEKFSEARIIFLDTEKSNWTWDDQAQQFYWHRFYSSQPDLNYDNPEVQQEMLDIMKFWLDLGIDGFRVDAIPYLYEREGTNGENLPETHAYLKQVRAFFDQHAPEGILLSEANQWPEDVRAYFGDGDEMHMAFHFPVMPRIFMALKRQDSTPIRQILERTPAIPMNNQWCTFLRNHDELTLEMVTEEERQWMWEQYAPEPRMRLNLGIRRRLAPLLGNNKVKILLANSLLFSLPGSPIVYYGDEIGMGDNIWLDDRNGVRTPMQWEDSSNAGFSPAQQTYAPVITEPPFSYQSVNVASQQADPNSLYHHIKGMIANRKNERVFGWGELAWAQNDHPEQILAYYRQFADELVLVVNNLSESEQTTRIELVEGMLTPALVDLLSQQTYSPTSGFLELTLPSYSYLWLKPVQPG
ncbi:MAG: maltose alpha-D-glucosyltransferase [Anaerolineales bacterium]|nr:maltose alpha-D-glucosyltransferase [Anaerolineales bacterium]MCW5856281.1 maltose alpha-D-glucosyltransferase [Anaerolineales bacterium]